jgi:translation elongation factor EF-1beta
MNYLSHLKYLRYLISSIFKKVRKNFKKRKNIRFGIEILSDFIDIEDEEVILDDFVNVFVKLDVEQIHIVIVANQTDNEKSYPMMIRKLTKEIVEGNLKFYATESDIKTLNGLNDRYIARSKLLDALLEKAESINIEND